MTGNSARALCCCVAAGMALAMPRARADAVTDWNAAACQILLNAELDPGSSHRALAIVHSAIYQAANAITQRYPATQAAAPAGASVTAAIAASSRAVLLALAPSQQAAIETAYQTALAGDAAGAAQADGIAVGVQAAAGMLALRNGDGAAVVVNYRPVTAAGVYVPTVIPRGANWGQRRPWLMTGAAAFRPGPPPALDSASWARDYNEVLVYGAKVGSRRSAEQTAAARFWAATMPAIFYELVRAVAEAPGRDLMQNARLYAAVAQATDDTAIAVFDAKYHYHFWRPITAIRNGDIDGNPATERDPGWTPLLDAPNHPEYPCAHCALASVMATVLQAELGRGAVPVLSTTSPTGQPDRRSWPTPAAFSQEVALARIHSGVHFRSSAEAGTAMGQRIGALAVAAFRLGAD